MADRRAVSSSTYLPRVDQRTCSHPGFPDWRFLCGCHSFLRPNLCRSLDSATTTFMARQCRGCACAGLSPGLVSPAGLRRAFAPGNAACSFDRDVCPGAAGNGLARRGAGAGRSSAGVRLDRRAVQTAFGRRETVSTHGNLQVTAQFAGGGFAQLPDQKPGLGCCARQSWSAPKA